MMVLTMPGSSYTISFINITVCSLGIAISRAIVVTLWDLGFEGNPIVPLLWRGNVREGFSSMDRPKAFALRGDRRRISSRPGERLAEVVLPLAPSTESPDAEEAAMVGIASEI
jgi:hypothetical protein